MRIRRTIIAPVILTIGAVGSLVAVPAVAAMTSVAPAATGGSEQQRVHLPRVI